MTTLNQYEFQVSDLLHDPVNAKWTVPQIDSYINEARRQLVIDTGCLTNVRGALIPCDRLIDAADAGKIHSVITGRVGTPAVDLRTGKPALWDVDEATAGGAVFLGGSMRRLATAAPGVSH